MLLHLLLLLSAGQAQSADPAALATLRQETLPTLRQRTTTAKERARAGEAFFTGEAVLAEAWPELVEAPLNSPGYLHGRLSALQARDEARALERIALPPDGLSSAQIAQRSKALSGAIEAEVRADALERQLLAALLAGLKKAPGLQADALEARHARLHALQQLPDNLDPSDPANAAVLEQARQAGELAGILSRYEQAAFLAMTVSGDLSLARLVRADLTRMEGRSALEQEFARDRIARAVPLLSEPLATEAQALLDALAAEELRWQIATLIAEEAALQETLDELAPQEDSNLEALKQAHEQEKTALADAQAALPSDEPTSEVTALQLEHAQRTVRRQELRTAIAAEQLRLAVEQADARSVAAGAAQTRAQVDDAQRKAEEARRQAEAAGRAELQELIVDLQALSERMGEAEQLRHAQVDDTISRLSTEQTERSQAINTAISAPPALRTTELQEEYIEQLGWIQRLRQRVSERRESVSQLASKNETVTTSELPTPEEISAAAGNDRDLTRNAQVAVEAVQSAMDERVEQARRETDAVARMLRQARAELRRIQGELSRVDQAAAERSAGIDPILMAAAELTDVPVLVAERYRTLQELQSWRLSNISRRVLSFLVQSFNIVLVLLGWNLLRTQGAEWVERLLRISQQLIPRSARQQRFDLWVDADLTGLTARLTPTIRPAADCLAAALIHAAISHTAPFLGIFTLLWLIATLLSLVPKLVDLVVVESINERFALLQTSAEVHQLLARTIRSVVWWWLLLVALRYLAYDVLRADMLAAVLSSLTLLVFLVLALRELRRWAPTIQAHVRNIGATGWLATWAIAPTKSTLLPMAQGFVGLILAISHLTGQLTALLLEGRVGLSWVGSLIAQHSLKQVNENCPPTTAEERNTIREAHHEVFLHDDLVQTIFEDFEAWRDDESYGGMVALIGASGTGKSLVLRRTIQRITASPQAPPLRFLAPPERTTDPDTVLRWLCAEVGDCEAENWSALADRLLEAEPMVFVIDNSHHLLLRAVGGFSALRRLINLMHATARRHYWLASFHRPTWSFLEGSAVPVSIDLFRTQVEIEPLTPNRLAAWLGENTRAAGFDFDFDNLVASAVLGADMSRSLERVKTAFWRRLADTSEGNPTIALHFWLSSLRHPAHPELEIAENPEYASLIPLDVALYNPPFAEQIDELTDTELFVLAAIVIHDGLNVAQLATALNEVPGILRSTCRHLRQLDVLVLHGTEYRINPPWTAAISRVLRQRHFLHNRG